MEVGFGRSLGLVLVLIQGVVVAGLVCGCHRFVGLLGLQRGLGLYGLVLWLLVVVVGQVWVGWWCILWVWVVCRSGFLSLPPENGRVKTAF